MTSATGKGGHPVAILLRGASAASATRLKAAARKPELQYRPSTSTRGFGILATGKQNQLNVRRGEPFFLAMGLVLLAIVIGGFLPTALSRPGGIVSMPPLLHLHGAVFVSWFVIFCAQARLAGSGNFALHMRLGKISVLVAAAMLILGYLVIRGAYANPDWSIAGMSGAASVMFPFTDLVNFTIAYSLAFANRRNPVAHKRLMLLAGILIIDPAVARLVVTIGAAAPWIIIVELALIATLFVYDLVTRGRPSWTSSLGLGLFVMALAAKLALSQQPGWHSLVEALFA
jgi:hypothetical protein